MPSQDQAMDIVTKAPDPSQMDKAVQMLSELFGQNWWKIMWSGEGLQGDASLIMPIVMTFNVIVFAAVGVLLFYLIGHAFVGSAHEGTPLGKRMHSIWAPIRSVFSIFLLAPIPWEPVFNIIQGICLTFIGFSIQFANLAVANGLDYIQNNHGQVVASVPSDVEETGAKIAKTAFNNYMIQYGQFYMQDSPEAFGYEKMVFPESEKKMSLYGTKGTGGLDEADQVQGYGHMVVYQFKNPEPLSSDVMGEVVIRCKDGDSDLCQFRQEAAEGLMADMENVAANKIRELAGLSSSVPSEGEVASMIKDYGTGMTDVIKQMMAEKNVELEQEIENFTEHVKQQGFMMLGSYFWTITRFNMALQDQIHAEPTFRPYNAKLLDEETSEVFNQIKINLKSGDRFFERMAKSYNIAETGSGSVLKTEEDIAEDDTTIEYIINKLDYLDSFSTAGVDTFIKGITNGDPIAGLAAWGHGLLNASIITLFALLGLAAIPAVGKAAAPFILIIIPPLFVLGISLAYYLPSVPFIIWAVAFFGWIIMVIELFIMAPLWAIMHANPDGEGISGQMASQGYIIFFQVLLRPTLMVIGFFFGLLLIHLMSYIGEMFTVFFHGLSANEIFAGPLTMIVGMFMGGVLMIVLTHKAFALVYILPENWPKWVGARSSSMGESQDVGQSQTMVAGAISHGRDRSDRVGGETTKLASKNEGGNKQSDSDYSQGEMSLASSDLDSPSISSTDQESAANLWQAGEKGLSTERG